MVSNPRQLVVVFVVAVLALGAWVVPRGIARSATVAAQSADVPAGWTNVTPSVSPVPMAGAMMAYSSRANRFVLFGGWDGVQGLNGTWTFDPANRTWAQLHPEASPMPRGDEMLVYDGRSDLFILFGGWYEFPNGSYMRLSDTWTFSLGEAAWTVRHPSSTPSPRSDSEVAYDPSADAVLLVGGFSGTHYLGDVWAYFPGNDTWWPRAVGEAPVARADGRMVYVPGQDRFLLFGGNNYSGPNFSFNHLADTWSYRWTSNTWSLIPTPQAPPARDYPIFAVDPAAGMALLASGFGNRTILNDLWGFNLTTEVWSSLATGAAPPPRYAGAGGFDPVDNVFVLFSGAGNAGLLSDLWYYRASPGTTAFVDPAAVVILVAGTSVILVTAVAAFVLRSRRQRSGRVP